MKFNYINELHDLKLVTQNTINNFNYDNLKNVIFLCKSGSRD